MYTVVCVSMHVYTYIHKSSQKNSFVFGSLMVIISIEKYFTVSQNQEKGKLLWQLSLSCLRALCWFYTN